MQEVKAVLNALRNMDLETVTIDEIKGQLFLLHDHVATRRTFPKNTVICRSVLMKEDDDVFISESRISYKKDAKGMDFGRATYEDRSAFYGCLNTEIIQSSMTSALEILPMSKKDTARYNLVCGKWIIEEDLELLFLGGSDNLIHLCDEGLERHNFLFDSIKNDHENIIILKLIDSFICNEFSKKVEESKPWEYKISACYAEMMKDLGEAGLVFPSVAANGAGLNIVLFPDSVDNGLIKLEYAAYGTFYNRNGEYVREYSMEAFNDMGLLRWREFYTQVLHGSIKKYYTGLSEHNPLENTSTVDLGARRIN